MKKRTSKLFTVALALVMMLSMTLMLTSCGDPETLQEYVEANPEVQEELDSAMAESAQDGMDIKVEIKENTILYTYKFDQTLDKDQAEQATELFESYMDKASGVFENIAQSCEEETKIDGIKCQVIYLNGDGSELYNGVFE